MCSAPNVYMFVYILIGTHMVPLNYITFHNLPLHGQQEAIFVSLYNAENHKLAIS